MPSGPFDRTLNFSIRRFIAAFPTQIALVSVLAKTMAGNKSEMYSLNPNIPGIFENHLHILPDSYF
jgi:hypothetical protein